MRVYFESVTNKSRLPFSSEVELHDKFAAIFHFIGFENTPDAYLGMIGKSAFVFNTRSEALEAGIRAEYICQETGSLPNLSERW